jgi:ATP-dependent DNA helicase RecQ
MRVTEPPIAGSAACPDLDRALAQHLGLERFRPGQREVIEGVLAGRDVLCVMPTGGGKSLCFQLPAVLTPGVTLVVSPLIALMKDQVDGLTARGVRATLLNSTLDPSELTDRMDRIENREFDLVYVAPERFQSGRFVDLIRRVRPALLAIDEAHCISQWGHDFRPDYARLGQARRDLGSPPCIALTATATEQVRRDIAGQLGLDDPLVFVAGFDRPNLSYRVAATPREADKQAELLRILEEAGDDGSIIVYASSRKRCEDVAAQIRHARRCEVAVYHAGLNRDDRHAAQDRFMVGEAPVIVATNAFGMGVDKPDIRAVIHYNMPGTLEAYYQEAGRAGRDGQPARCDLLYQERFIEEQYPPADAFFQLYDYLRRFEVEAIATTAAELASTVDLGIKESGVGVILRHLEAAGAIERSRDGDLGPAISVVDRTRSSRDLKLDFRLLAERRRNDLEKLSRMVAYANGHTCRTRTLLDYFGDTTAGGESKSSCNRCDRCDPSGGRAPASYERVEIAGEKPVELVLKALSGVARTRAAVGRTRIAEMLAGVRNESIERLGLDSLSTFGVLGADGFNAKQAVRLLDALAASRLVEADEPQPFRPVLRLTEAGWAWMRAKSAEERAPLALDLPPEVATRFGASVRPAPRRKRSSSERPTPDAEPSPELDPVRERLRALRTAEAKATGVPPYCIYSDKTLEALARSGARSAAELMEVPGIGPAKAGRYGQAILAALTGGEG